MAEESEPRARDASGRFVSKTDAEEPGNGKEEAEEPAGDRKDEAEEPAGNGKEEAEEQGQGSGGDVEDISDTPAPSIGPHSVVEREPVEVRLARHEQSEVDAMGNDKRRQVVGQSYGPSFAKQASLYGIFLVVVVALAIGAKILIDHVDTFPDKVPTQAVWAKPGVKQVSPRPLP